MRKTQISWGEKGHYKQELEKSYKLRDHKVDKKKKNSEMEQDPMVLVPHVLSLPFVHGKTLTKKRLIREMRKYRNKRKQSNNNRSIIKQSQGLLVPLQRLQIIF